MSIDFVPDFFLTASRDELCATILSLAERLDLVESLVLQFDTRHSALLVDYASALERIKHLEGIVAKDSHNSGKPPSSDGLAKKPSVKNLRVKGQRKPGGQPGHKGTTLKMVDNPDHIVPHPPHTCSGCGASLENVAPHAEFDRRQVHDLPPKIIEVTEHRRQYKTCPGCGQIHKGEFPSNVTRPAQYGDIIKALAIYCVNDLLLSWSHTVEMMQDLFGCSFSEGELHSVLNDAAANLAQTKEQIKGSQAGAPSCPKEAVLRPEPEPVCCDETGQRFGAETGWLHVYSKKDWTYYESHLKRGKEAADEIGILPAYTGKVMHDGLKSYQGYTNCIHHLCNAHHLRELLFLAEEEGQIWAIRMFRHLKYIYKCVLEAKEQGQTELDALTISSCEHTYDILIVEGFQTNPELPRQNKRGRAKQTKGYNLLKRLEKRGQVLGFMYDFAVPFDNNLAERDLRMMKVKQKVSGCFRTKEGAKNFATIRSYISTMRKQGHNILAVLQTVIQGQPRAPAFQNSS